MSHDAEYINSLQKVQLPSFVISDSESPRHVIVRTGTIGSLKIYACFYFAAKARACKYSYVAINTIFNLVI